jgi:hypothetical protein
VGPEHIGRVGDCVVGESQVGKEGGTMADLRLPEFEMHPVLYSHSIYASLLFTNLLDGPRQCHARTNVTEVYHTNNEYKHPRYKACFKESPSLFL